MMKTIFCKKEHTPVRFVRLLIVVSGLVTAMPLAAGEPIDPSTCGGVLLNIGYMGENLSHPGGFTSVEFPFSFCRRSYIEARIELGSYVHPKNSWAILAEGGIGFGTILPCGFHTGLSLGIGYIHTFLASPLYTVTDGSLLRLPNRGSPGLLLSMTGKIGWDGCGVGLPMGVFLAFKTFGRYPYNGMILPHFALQAGVSFRFKTGERA